jgi:hypothetical protein
MGGMLLNLRAFKYLGGCSPKALAALFPPDPSACMHLPRSNPQFAPCPLCGSDAMDAIRFSLLAVFLSTSAELKIHDAADSYQMIQSQCLPHIATWWTVFQFEYHKTSRWPVLCNPVTVCRHDTFSSTGVAYSYPANTDSNSPAFHDIYDPQSASDTSDVSDADVTNTMDTSDTHRASGVDVGAAADAVDADVFQQLSQGDVDLMSTYPSEIAVDRPPDVLEVPAEQSIEFESHFSDTSSVVVDTFPFGNPGAPIPGVPQGRSSYELFQVTQEGIWAPFRSQRDWDIARWTKTHSTTSSAVADLLAIPEVCANCSCHPLCPLFTILGPRYTRAFISHRQGTERSH